MSIRYAVIVGLSVALALGSGGCGGSDEAGGIRRSDPDDQPQSGMLALGDTSVVEALKAPRVPGRIIYDPPTDLSHANAMRTRPDLVRGDTTRRDTSRTAVRRDSTGGDATADTSGGAARRRRP